MQDRETTLTETFVPGRAVPSEDGSEILLHDINTDYMEDYAAIPGAKWRFRDGEWRWIYENKPEIVLALHDMLGYAALDKSLRKMLPIAYSNGHECLSKVPLWEHQMDAYQFAYNKQAAMLAMDMGTGKSAVAISLVVNHNLNPVLILCPKSVIGVWPKQFEKFSAIPYRVLTINDKDGTVPKRAEKVAKQLDMQGNLVVVMNYEACWRRPMADLLLAVRWGAVICDESHKIKAPGGRASRYVARLRAVSRYRYALTGTPLPHSPLDAYGQFRFLDPSVFGGSFTHFRSHYAIMGGYGGYEVTGYKNQMEFNKKFYSISYRCKASDVLTLPEYVDTERYCTLSDSAARTYRQLESVFYAEVAEGTVTVSNALTKLLRLQQLTSGYLRLDDGSLQVVDDSKIALLADVLDDIPKDEPVVVFCRFTHDLQAVKELAASVGRPAAELSGEVKQLEEWQRGEYNLLAAQLQAGGLGVDFTRSRYQIYYSLGFSLGDYEQSLKRIHRPGQTRSVLYIKLISQGTVDEKVRDALAERKQVVEKILEEIKGSTKYQKTSKKRGDKK
jgi:SNF2 family DNA or RNA helicase